MKRPAFQFYPADWRKDNELRVCSIAARGLWIDMMAIMHEGDPYGHLTVAGCPVTTAQLASLVGVTPAQCKHLLAELETHRVFSRTDAGVIFSRRMVHDEDVREKRAAYGNLSLNNPAVPRPKDTPKDTIRRSFGGSPSVAVAVSASSAELQTAKEDRAPKRRRASSPRPETWLTPLHDAHEALYGKGSFAPLAGEFARYWRRLVEKNGGEKCARVWTFAHTSGTERDREFRTPKSVASRFAQFDPDGPAFPQEAA